MTNSEQDKRVSELREKTELNELRARDAEARLRIIEAEMKILEMRPKLEALKR